MEAVYYAVRANLRRFMHLHPQWTQPQYAQAVGMSVGWVKKWKKRLQEAEPEDEQVLHSRSRARLHPPERISEAVVDRILQMRDEQLEGERLPRSSRTVYRILQQAGRIVHRQRQEHEPQERPAPMNCWELDFKDATTVLPEIGGKRQHGVEVLNVIDEGTSVLVDAQVSADFHAETTLEAVAELFVRQGLPQVVRMVRMVRRDGSVRVDLKSYYVSRALAGRHVALHLSAATRALLVVHERRVIKTLPLKGLTGKTLRFEAFVQLMQGQARSERRLRNDQERRVRLGASGSP